MLFRHYKGGIYRYVALALDEETKEVKVVYQSEGPDATTWVRPAADFFGSVDTDAHTGPRFTPMPERKS